MSITQEVNVKIFHHALYLAVNNDDVTLNELIDKWTHKDIVKEICQVELKAIRKLTSDFDKGKDNMLGHRYYSLYKDYPNYEEIKENHIKELQNLNKQFEYINDDPSMLLSMDDESLSLFRFILKGMFEEKVIKQNINNFTDKTKENITDFIIRISETWALLYWVGDQRDKIMVDNNSTVENVARILSFFNLDSSEISLIMENFEERVLSI